MKRVSNGIFHSAVSEFPEFDDSFDYLYFRQDVGGQELIYFNSSDLLLIQEQIRIGKIIVNQNYSILWAKTEQCRAVAEVMKCFPCVICKSVTSPH